MGSSLCVMTADLGRGDDGVKGVIGVDGVAAGVRALEEDGAAALSAEMIWGDSLKGFIWYF